jgi:peptidoglycan/LPS O-acetylase OafA/YrhL
MNVNASSGREISRLHGLDGLRAVAISLVLVAHSRHFPGFPTTPWVQRVSNAGNFGVDMFFVLSGFLITWLLLKEETTQRTFSLRSFYLRRALRILPPAFLYLLCLALLGRRGVVSVSLSDIVASAAFVRNLTVGSMLTGHFWSLAIEEQFYLLWPFLLNCLPGFRARLQTVAILIVLAPVWRHLNIVLAGGAMNLNWSRFDLRYDALLIGCMLAFLRSSPQWKVSGPYQLIHKPVFPLIASGLIWFSTLGPSMPGYIALWKPSISYLAVAGLVDFVVDERHGILARILNLSFVRNVGLMSYSLYLWQQLCFFNPAITSIGIALAASCMAAAVSYFLVERPLATLRQRLPPAPGIAPVPLAQATELS